MKFETEILHGIDAIDEVYDEWVAILPTDRWAIFSHPNWYRAQYHTYFSGTRLSIIVVRKDKEVVGILPICSRRMNRYGLFLPVSEVLAGQRADYWTPIVKEKFEREVFNVLFEESLRITRKHRTGTFIFPRIPNCSSAKQRLEEVLNARNMVFHKHDTVCPWFSLEHSYADAEKGWSKSHRGDIRRQSNRIAKEYGELSLHVIRDKDEALDCLPDLFDMNDRRWLEKGMPGTFADEDDRTLYENYIKYLWEDGVHFSALLCGDSKVAYHFGFLVNGYLLYYKPVHNIDLHNYSPGKLLLVSLIKEGINRGWHGIDMLQGDERYKTLWCQNVNTTSTYSVRTKLASPSYYWITKGRPWAEEQVGEIYRRSSARIQKLRRKIGG